MVVKSIEDINGSKYLEIISYWKGIYPIYKTN